MYYLHVYSLTIFMQFSIMTCQVLANIKVNSILKRQNLLTFVRVIAAAVFSLSNMNNELQS